MGGLTDRLLYRIYWFFFEWNLNAVKWKANHRRRDLDR